MASRSYPTTTADPLSTGKDVSTPNDELTRLRERVEALEKENELQSRELIEMERLDRRLLRQHGSESDVLRQILEVIESRLPGVDTAVAVSEPSGETLRIAVSSGLDESDMGIPLTANAGPVGQTLRGGSPRTFPARRFHFVGKATNKINNITL